MVQNPERESPLKPEAVGEKSKASEVPVNVERVGSPITQAPTTAQPADDSRVQDDQAKSQTIAIQVPTSQDQLEEWSHGSPTNALTWFAAFWLRLIKKALHFGWRIIGKVNPKSKQ